VVEDVQIIQNAERALDNLEGRLSLREEDIATSSILTQVVDTSHLFQCAGDTLGDALLNSDPDIADRDLENVLAVMKSLAVIPVATGVLRSELLGLRKNRDEPIRCFAVRTRGKAETCNFISQFLCECGKLNNVNYMEHIMHDVVIAGIYDADICRDILAIDDVIIKPINDVIGLIEGREMARDAHP
jgi:hypothetical protein